MVTATLPALPGREEVEQHRTVTRRYAIPYIDHQPLGPFVWAFASTDHRPSCI